MKVNKQGNTANTCAKSNKNRNLFIHILLFWSSILSDSKVSNLKVNIIEQSNMSQLKARRSLRKLVETKTELGGEWMDELTFIRLSLLIQLLVCQMCE